MGKKKKILLFSGLALLLITAILGIVFGLLSRLPAAGETTSKLYWNADRDQYIPELGGDTIRKPEADGFYTVRFLVEGELVEYRVKDRETMISVDEKSALGLEIDKDGFITQAIDIRDMGIREVAKSFYVQTMQDNVVVANSSVTGSAVDVSLRTSAETSIWNVTGKVEPLGVKDKLQLMDCIRAFNNSEGQITDIFIVEREDILNGVSAERYCAHCDQEVTWRMWLGENSLPYSSGHFRLITDVELPDQYSMPAETDLILDLNGKTISRKTQGRIISLHAEGDKLSIVDGSEEKNGVIKAYGEYAANGGTIWVRYGTFSMYAGTIDASKVVDAGANGAAIQVNPDTTFNMYGGKIIGGTSKPAVLKNEETGEKYTSGGMGGSIYCQGTFNMYDGEITGGKVVSAKDHKGQMAGIAGGNIALISKGTMNMYGGKISGGTVATPEGHGGNISVRSEGAVLNIKGGEIVNGVSMLQGANIASWGTITMTGGTIKNGKNMTGKALKGAKYNEESTSHNIFLVSSKLDMKGGTIGGFVDAVNGLQNKKGEYIDCKLILSGNAKIKGGKTNLTARTNMIQFGKLSSGAYISVNGSGYISKETVASNQKYVHSDYEGSDVLYLQKRLFIGKQDCVCGLDENGNHYGECDGTPLAWQPWTKDTYAPIEEGNWYLLTDVQAEGITEPKPNVTLRLDLNGKTLTGAKDRRVYSTVNGNVKLTITDLSEEKNGSIVAQTGDKPENLGRGGCVWATNKESKVTFYGGILDASKVTSIYNGAAVSVDPGCTFTMYGGTINGGKVVKASDDTEGFAGSVFVRGQFFMNGGVIQGGTAEQHGGNIYIHTEEGAKFHMTGGKVLGGTAVNGGNISGMGLISIAGGTVANGEAQYGGNICARRTMIMTGGEIIDGTARGGGNIFASDSSDLTVSGGTISGGIATIDEGGNLRIWTNSKLNISNAVIKDGEAKKDGGNIYLNDLIDAKITNATITGGISSANGGNICIGKEAWETKNFTKAIISGTEIRDGYAEGLGGNVYVRKSNTTLSGAVVILDAQNGGNMYVAKDVRVSLDGLTSANASIGVSSVDSTFAKNANVDKSDVARFISDEGYPIAQNSDNELFIGRLGCLCGNHNGSHETWCTEDLRDIEWQPWNTKISKNESNQVRLPQTAGYYYLTEDIELDARATVNDAKVFLDLNGHKVTATDGETRVIFIEHEKAEYSITDTSNNQTGAIQFDENSYVPSKYYGMLVFYSAAGKVNLYGGTLDMSNVEYAHYNMIDVSTGQFNVYGGTIKPVVARADGQSNAIGVRGSGVASVMGGTVYGEVILQTKANTLTVGGDAKVGIPMTGVGGYGITAWEDNTNVVCKNLTKDADIRINSVKIKLSDADDSSSEVSAIKLIADNDGHNAVVKYNNKVRIASVICVCGENVNGKTSHTCAWTGAGNGIEKVYNIKWQAHTATSGAFPGASEAGYYYLTKDYALTRTDLTKVAALDLNGKTVTASNSWNIRIESADANYAITDSKGNGTIVLPEGHNFGAWGSMISFQKTGTFTVYGGTIDMSNATNGAYAHIDVLKGKFVMHGGTIIPAKIDTSYANAIHARTSTVDGVNYNGSVEVTGGTIYGEVILATKGNTLTVGGNAKVGLPMDGIAGYGILAWEDDTNVICKNLTADADIRVNSIKIKLTDANDSSSEVSAIKLLADNNGRNAVVKYNNKVRTASIICVCGENVKDKNSHTCAWTGAGNGIEKVYNIKWQAYSEASGALPGASTAGYYYLTKDFALTRSDLKVVSYLDLNGKTVTASNSWNIRIESENANYAITDSKGNGTIKFPQGHNFGAWGAMVSFQQPGKFTVYGGTIDMSAATNGTYAHIDIQKGQFVMNGGTIIPVKIATSCANALHARNSGTIKLAGGTVYGKIILASTANTLTVSGNAKAGLPMDGIANSGIDIWAYNTPVNCSNLTDTARVVFTSSGNAKLTDGYEIANVNGELLLKKKATQ